MNYYNCLAYDIKPQNYCSYPTITMFMLLFNYTVFLYTFLINEKVNVVIIG